MKIDKNILDTILKFFNLSKSSQTIDIGSKVEYIVLGNRVIGIVKKIDGKKAKIASNHSQYSTLIRWVEIDKLKVIHSNKFRNCKKSQK